MLPAIGALIFFSPMRVEFASMAVSVSYVMFAMEKCAHSMDVSHACLDFI